MKMHSEKTELAEIARRLTKTRSLSSIEQKKTTTNQKSRNRSDSAMFWRRKSTDNYLHDVLDDGQISDKIKQWLSSSNSELHEEIDDYRQSRKSTKGSIGAAFDSILEIESNEKSAPIASDGDIESTKLNYKLMDVVIRSGCTLENVTWEISDCDILLKVDNMLFPVKKNFVSYVSTYFQNIFDKLKVDEDNNEIIIYPLNGYDENEIRKILEFIYSAEEEQVSDENVAALLQLGSEFGVSRLRFQCETHLQNSRTFNPFIALHLSKQYNLDTLYEYSLKEISKMENIENTLEFDALDFEIQNKILKFILKRYQKATRTLSQFDVHLCNYHGNDPKNNTCCFRAATYNTENDRIFLVKMENPEKKLVDCYEKAFNVESTYLDHDSS